MRRHAQAAMKFYLVMGLTPYKVGMEELLAE